MVACQHQKTVACAVAYVRRQTRCQHWPDLLGITGSYQIEDALGEGQGVVVQGFAHKYLLLGWASVTRKALKR